MIDFLTIVAKKTKCSYSLPWKSSNFLTQALPVLVFIFLALCANVQASSEVQLVQEADRTQNAVSNSKQPLGQVENNAGNMPSSNLESKPSSPSTLPNKSTSDSNTLADKRPGRIGFSEFIMTFTSLILILFLIIGIAWLIKRSGFIIGSDNQLIRLLASVQVGQKERIALIQVGDEQILVGVAAGNVQKIHVMKEPVVAQKNSQQKNHQNIFDLTLKKFQQIKKVEK